jgi:hypothetical protein
LNDSCRYELNDLFFLNRDTGYVVGNNQIFKTEDGGEVWEAMADPTDGMYQASLPQVDNLSSFCFINDTTGWCSGSDGIILKTSSAGIVSIKNIEYAPNVGQEKFRLEQNFTNPFDTHTIISYNLPVDGPVRLVVYNMQGEEVRILVNGKQSAGSYSFTFDGAGLTSGIYYYKLTDTWRTSVKEMLPFFLEISIYVLSLICDLCLCAPICKSIASFSSYYFRQLTLRLPRTLIKQKWTASFH